jgi:hypothetical protein
MTSILELNDTEKRINEITDQLFWDDSSEEHKELLNIELKSLIKSQSFYVEYLMKVCCEKKAILEARVELRKKAQKMEASSKNQLDFIKGLTIEKMHNIGINKINTDLFSGSIGQSKVLELEEGVSLEDKYIKVIPASQSIDKTLLKKDIKNGKEIEGARIVDGKTFLTIR